MRRSWFAPFPIAWVSQDGRVDRHRANRLAGPGEGDRQRDAATDACGRCVAPARHFRGKVEDAPGAWGVVEESAAVSHRVLFSLVGELVHEALDHEDRVRGADATPECGRDTRGL